MLRDVMTFLRYHAAAGGSMKESLRRALVGLVLLSLLMAAVSFLSARMKRGESAAHVAEREGESVSEGGADAVNAVVNGEIAVTTERDSASEGTESLPEGVKVGGDPGNRVTEDEPSVIPHEVYRESSDLDLGGGLLKVFLGLVAVIILILTIRLMVGKKAGRRGNLTQGSLEVMGYTPLGPCSGIYEVRAGTRILIVGEAEKGLVLLGVIDAESLVKAEDAEILEDEFLALLREEMAAPVKSESPIGKRTLLEEFKWKTARKRGRASR